MASTSSLKSELSDKAVSQPEVIKFGYTDLVIKIKANKWTAKCCSCHEMITETRGTTTGFARYVDATISYFILLFITSRQKL